jgi:hypothetical protein
LYQSPAFIGSSLVRLSLLKSRIALSTLTSPNL